jgi:hypothetical protein
MCADLFLKLHDVEAKLFFVIWPKFDIFREIARLVGLAYIEGTFAYISGSDWPF